MSIRHCGSCRAPLPMEYIHSVCITCLGSTHAKTTVIEADCTHCTASVSLSLCCALKSQALEAALPVLSHLKSSGAVNLKDVWMTSSCRLSVLPLLAVNLLHSPTRTSGMVLSGNLTTWWSSQLLPPSLRRRRLCSGSGSSVAELEPEHSRLVKDKLRSSRRSKERRQPQTDIRPTHCEPRSRQTAFSKC